MDIQQYTRWTPYFTTSNTNTNTNNCILHQIKNNKTLATCYFSNVEFIQYNTTISNTI